MDNHHVVGPDHRSGAGVPEYSVWTAHKNVVKYGLQRFGCCKTFNDKTGSLLHYKHVSIGNWMLALWLFLCGPLNGVSIRFISQATGQAYKTAYYMMRGIMARIRNLPEKPHGKTKAPKACHAACILGSTTFGPPVWTGEFFDSRVYFFGVGEKANRRSCTLPPKACRHSLE